MLTSSITNDLIFNDEKPAISVLLETSHTKEVRIAIKKGQMMKEHQTPFPIVVEIFEGEIVFGVEGKTIILNKGDLIALEGKAPHNLSANLDSIVRLSLSKSDTVERVKEVIE